MEGREREGPKLLLNQGPSEPCYATGTNKTFAGNHGRLVYSILYRVQLKCVITKPAISHKRLIWRTGNMTDQTVSDPTLKLPSHIGFLTEFSRVIFIKLFMWEITILEQLFERPRCYLEFG